MADPTSSYRLEFPRYLDGYEVETEAKGYLVDVRILAADATFDLTIYDPSRLSQEIADEIGSNGYFVVRNLLVIPKVNKNEITRAVQECAKSRFHGLAPGFVNATDVKRDDKLP